MNPDGTFNFTVVNDADGTFRVHRTGCADVTRRMRNSAWDVRAPDAEAVVKNERESLREEFGSDADDFEFVILPCATYVDKWQGRPVA